MLLEIVNALYGELSKQVHKQVIGQHKALRLIVAALFAEGHVLMEDVPGVGKTTLAKALAQVFKAHFTRVQATPDLLPQDLLGAMIFRQNTGEFELRKGPIFTQILLYDEINRSTPRTASALLEAMAERQVSIDGRTEPLPSPFFVIATQNPLESQGVFPLPEAQLDRFLIKAKMGYPSLDEEVQIMERFRSGVRQQTPEAIITPQQLLEIQQQCRKITVSDDIKRYIYHIVNATRTSKQFLIGGSPRASLGLMSLAQSFAYIDGRIFVTADDIKEAVIPVISHRVQLNPEGLARGATEETALQAILVQVQVPAEAKQSQIV